MPTKARKERTRKLYRDFHGWSLSDELRAEALAKGLRPETLARRIKALCNTPIAGKGVYDRDLHVSEWFDRWLVWQTADDSAAAAAPATRRSVGAAESPTAGWGPNQRHRAFCERCGLELDGQANLFRRSLRTSPKSFEPTELDGMFGAWLKAAAKALKTKAAA